LPATQLEIESGKPRDNSPRRKYRSESPVYRVLEHLPSEEANGKASRFELQKLSFGPAVSLAPWASAPPAAGLNYKITRLQNYKIKPAPEAAQRPRLSQRGSLALPDDPQIPF
jgi:hypothetical protein